jgi:hypothetical protein
MASVPSFLKTKSRLHQYFVFCTRISAAAQTVAVPGATTLLREVQEHQRKTDAIRENYTSREIVRIDTFIVKRDENR